MKKIIPFIVMALLVVSCQHKEEKHKSIPTLRVTNLILKDTTITRKYVSQIHAMRHIELRALERGYLQKIYVDEGQKVEKGQTMFAINANVYKAELQKSKSEARAAEIEYDNTKMLSDKNVVSKNELALAEARLAKANAEVLMAQTHLNFTTIHAPFTGIMDHLEAREGSLLDEGELLTKISDNSKMWVYFNVPESEYINYVTDTTTHASSVQLQMANSAIFNHKGKVETIEGEFNHETGNIEFRATFPNPESLLRHGQTGNILMNIPFKNAKIIPQKATFEILDKKYVFVVNDKDEVEQRQINILEELPYLYIVKDGIDSNDRILIDGLRKVRNGQKINADFIEPKTVLADLKLVAE